MGILMALLAEIVVPKIYDLLIFFLVSLTLALSPWEREEKSGAMFQGEGYNC
jgi:hypothetical protein